jgi:hypothetical protein
VAWLPTKTKAGWRNTDSSMNISKFVNKYKWPMGVGVVLFAYWLSQRHHMGFADDKTKKSKPLVQERYPSHINDPSSPLTLTHETHPSHINSSINPSIHHTTGDELYDIDFPTSGRHKGDIELTDLGPYSTPKKTHHRHEQGSIYPTSSNQDCCAMLQQIMSQGGGGGGGGPPMMGGMAGYGYGNDDIDWVIEDW